MISVYDRVASPSLSREGLKKSEGRASAFLLAWCLLFGAVGHAQAVEFYAIIANLNNARAPHAQMDVAVDTQAGPGGVPTPVLFNVFRADGSPLAEFQVLTNPNGFASSAFAEPPYDNLFTVSEGLPALVAASTFGTSSGAGAVLRQTLKPSNILLDLPPARRSDGTGVAQGKLFSVAIGEIADAATLLIANLSGSDVHVDVFLGSKGGPGGGKYVNPRLRINSIWIVDVDPADANSHFIVSSTGDIVVQVAVDAGKKNTVTEVTVMPL